MDKVGSGKWSALYDLGKPFRQLSDRWHFRVGAWASEDMESWVEERLSGQKIIQASDILSYLDPSFSLAGPMILFLFEHSSVSGFRTGSRCPVPYTPRPEHST
ncbi:hypothetical protein K443DRAFT_659857 [Laccaria amethystina LaAM-08-1]|uniref:Uncharacterized protein n=1 Tax=Laccaria amethystina LaAM-08-1 TaxID=1095629 RepID=A0A0C9WSW6_9AGAR|nr:hypothetical protein K443DRAFT_659857 [Laccaria amethystina LaAM-08-1]